MTEEIENNGVTEQESTKTIFDCWNEAIRRFFDVKGRTTRYEFWAFQTVSLFIFILASLVGLVFGYYKIIFELFALYFLAPATTVSVRRLHDLDNKFHSLAFSRFCSQFLYQFKLVGVQSVCYRL